MNRSIQISKISSIIDHVLSSNGYLSIVFEGQISIKWRSIVGEKLAEVSECRGVENGILYVRVESSAWRQEMSFLKELIVQKIHEQTRCRSVRDIVFC